MSAQIYVDESKSRDYLLVAAVVAADDLASARATVRGLIMPGQRRLHMSTESDPRRRAIAAAICAMNVRATVYLAARGWRNEKEPRSVCLRAVVGHAATIGASRLVLEQDETLVRWDNRQLIELTRAAGCRDSLRYEHQQASAEVLLALPDAIAWCWARGGDWRRRVEGVVAAVKNV